MHEYGIPLRAFAAYGSEESLAFLDWNARFDERCRALHCISGDAVARPRQSSRARRPPQPIAWIESPALAAGRAALAASAKRADPLRAAPRLTPRDARSRRATSRPIRRRPSLRRSPPGRGESAGDAGFRAWVCVPRFELRAAPRWSTPWMRRWRRSASRWTRSPAGRPYAVAGGTPLADYAPVRAALESLAASVGAGAVRAIQRPAALAGAAGLAGRGRRRALAGCGACARDGTERGAARRLAGARGRAAARATWPVAALERLQRGRACHSRQLRGDSSDEPLGVGLDRGARSGSLALARIVGRASEYQSAERFRELLATLAVGRSHLRHAIRASRRERILQARGARYAFQVQTGIPPIWVSGQLIDPWLTYEGLWVSGCDEQRWPPPADPIPLLPVQACSASTA